LIQQGQRADFLYVVVEGQIEVFSRHRDRETTVSILGPGHCFILAAVFLDQVYLKSARTISSARLLLLPAAAVRAVFGSDPVFAHRIAAEMAKGYRSLVKEVNNLKLRTSLERLANWILRQAPGSGPTSSFTFPFDKKTLAGQTRRHTRSPFPKLRLAHPLWGHHQWKVGGREGPRRPREFGQARSPHRRSRSLAVISQQVVHRVRMDMRSALADEHLLLDTRPSEISTEDFAGEIGVKSGFLLKGDGWTRRRRSTDIKTHSSLGAIR
jgi:CRP-like cAMP-binding protein